MKAYRPACLNIGVDRQACLICLPCIAAVYAHSNSSSAFADHPCTQQSTDRAPDVQQSEGALRAARPLHLPPAAHSRPHERCCCPASRPWRGRPHSASPLMADQGQHLQPLPLLLGPHAFALHGRVSAALLTPVHLLGTCSMSPGTHGSVCGERLHQLFISKSR